MLRKLVQKIMTTDGVIQLLKGDHKKVQTLFQEFQETEDRRAKTNIAQTALRELDVHAALEEELFYPALRAEIDDEQMMDEALEEHHVAHLLINELKKMKPADKRYDAKFKVLAESVKHHIKEEESRVLPKAEESGINTPELLEQVSERKQELLENVTSRRTGPKNKARSNKSSSTRRSKKRRAA
jgi:hemerythrin superfamily protein